METGDTARSGTLYGAPPEYETTATDFLSQLAPHGRQLLFESHSFRRHPIRVAQQKPNDFR